MLQTACVGAAKLESKYTKALEESDMLKEWFYPFYLLCSKFSRPSRSSNPGLLNPTVSLYSLHQWFPTRSIWTVTPKNPRWNSWW